MENAAIEPAIQRRFPHNIVVMLIGSYSFPDIVAVNDERALMRLLRYLRTKGEASCRASLLRVLRFVWDYSYRDRSCTCTGCVSPAGTITRKSSGCGVPAKTSLSTPMDSAICAPAAFVVNVLNG